MEQIFFMIITNVGSARSSYIEAIHKAKNGDFERAGRLLEEGKAAFIEGHRIHADLISKEAAGEGVPVSLILVHAEDQLMSAEGFGILAEEFVDLYKKIL